MTHMILKELSSIWSSSSDPYGMLEAMIGWCCATAEEEGEGDEEEGE